MAQRDRSRTEEKGTMKVCLAIKYTQNVDEGVRGLKICKNSRTGLMNGSKEVCSDLRDKLMDSTASKGRWSHEKRTLNGFTISDEITFRINAVAQK